MRLALAGALAGLTICGVACSSREAHDSDKSRNQHVLATWAQITDAHVVDEESPARVEMLDRLGPPFTAAFRPAEALSGQVLAAVVAAVNRQRPDAVVVTGDLIDNAQANELREALGVFAGGRVDPDSGGRGYDGVQEASNADPFYYRPQIDPPRHPGLLERAERPFESPGLRAPWYPVAGNHDLLVQGNLAPTARTRAVATGPRKLVSVERGALETVRHRRLTQKTVDSILAGGLPGRARFVPADPKRRELGAGEVLASLRAASHHGGHGPLLDYSFALGPGVRGIVLDTIRRSAGASGLVRPSQLVWLRRQLRQASSRWIVVFSHTPLASCDPGGATALRLLDRNRHVVAAVAGDTHRNSVARRGGYALVTTSSLADWPQQARMFRLSERRGGGVVLATWTVDPDPSPLARISHELAYIDYQGGRPAGDAGSRADRRARVVIPPAAP